MGEQPDVRYALRIDTEENWDTIAPETVIPANRLCIVSSVTNDFKIKLTDGQTEWQHLPYFGASFQNKLVPGQGIIINTTNPDFPMISVDQTTLDAFAHMAEFTLPGGSVQPIDLPDLIAPFSGSVEEQSMLTFNTDTEGQMYFGKSKVLDPLIPAQASSTNQLADKDFVNSSIQNMASNYITFDIEGNPFPTRNDLMTAITVYFQGEVYQPTNNDYTLVTADEGKGGATTRFRFDGTNWVFQYILNETAFTANQLAAINSGATATIISSVADKMDKITPPLTANAYIATLDGQGQVVNSYVGFRDIGEFSSTTTDTEPILQFMGTNRIESTFCTGQVVGVQLGISGATPGFSRELIFFTGTSPTVSVNSGTVLWAGGTMPPVTGGKWYRLSLQAVAATIAIGTLVGFN